MKKPVIRVLKEILHTAIALAVVYAGYCAVRYLQGR